MIDLNSAELIAERKKIIKVKYESKPFRRCVSPINPIIFEFVNVYAKHKDVLKVIARMRAINL